MECSIGGDYMKYEEKNGLRILTSEFGYLIHNTKTDVYAEKFYLGIYAILDDFEEVPNDEIDEKLIAKFNEIEKKEQSLEKIGKIVANQVTDDIVALSIKEFYDEWASDIEYKINQYIIYQDILYKVLVDHTSQVTWVPDISPSLYAKVLADPTGETILDWVQPDSTNAYMKGDRVRFEDHVYESLIDNNVWSPSAYPAAWQLIE